MIAFYKLVNNGYIDGIGTNGNDSVTEISESEYNEILSVIKSAPHAEDKGYRLKNDLTWEEYDLPVPSEDEELTDEEALSIITGESA